MASAPEPPAPRSYNPSIPPPFNKTSPAPEILAQGAEGILFKSYFLTPSIPCAIKYRPAKTWRHPILDARLTRHRILSEARILVKCRRDGISVPGVLALDWEGSSSSSSNIINPTVSSESPSDLSTTSPGADSGVDAARRKYGGWMMVEWIEGATVRRSLDAWLPKHNPVKTEPKAEEKVVPERRPEVLDLMRRIGSEIGRMHQAGVIHGDLTTSNLMLRHGKRETSNGNHAGHDSNQRLPPLGGNVVLIDFGLATQATQEEDRAVDLYVLERAFGSTHPDTEDLFDELLRAYGQSFKAAKIVLKRLEDVRMRGRKKSMIG